MGIPAYFRWISSKYPRMMVDCVERLVTSDSAAPKSPEDISPPNPNGVEFDNLYLDMNGIIHPCTHPEDRPAPTTEAEMFDAVFDYIDRIMAIVRPRRVLYLAIDGVAPRAKINQQRSRRFRAAQEAAQKRQEAAKLRAEWREKGLKVSSASDGEAEGPGDSHEHDDDPDADGTNDDDVPSGECDQFSADRPFDSNVITPGTPFMARLAVALREYAMDRVTNRPGWENLRIIFSDAAVPGEGEHKIAEFIRVERAMPGYNPNLHHVLYGLDADLIMLALATHEIHFTVLREEVFPKQGAPRRNDPKANQLAAAPASDSIAAAIAAASVTSAKNGEDSSNTRALLGGRKPFHFLHVHILREYLDLEFRFDIERELAAAQAALQRSSMAKPVMIERYDLDNVIDDFVFLCFFVGNDFLPHLPTLDIREGAVDFLIEVYKTDLVYVGYLTSGSGDVDFGRVRQMLGRIGVKEDEVFQERKSREAMSLARAARDKENAEAAKLRQAAAKAQQEVAQGAGNQSSAASMVVEPGSSKVLAAGDLVTLGDKSKFARIGDGSANREAAAALKRSRKRRGGQKSKKALGVSAGGVTKDAPSGKKPGPSESAQGSQTKTPTQESATTDADGSEPVEDPESLDMDDDNDENADNANAEDGSGGEPATDNAASQKVVVKDPSEFEEELKQRIRDQNVIKNPVDNVRLGEHGWKDRYYKNKMNWEANDAEQKQKMFHSYIEGLYWVMKYYYVGCVSWVWYYPYHYAPFASDIVSCETTSAMINLELGQPFHPFTQLQAVMPPSSGKLVLPKCYSDLMVKASSPIIDYYPEDFDIDLNGKRFAWQGVALLPFIDEKRLHAALDGLDEKLTDSERRRNAFGHSYVIVHQSTPLGKFVSSLAREAGPDAGPGALDQGVPDDVADGLLFGRVSLQPEEGGGSGPVLPDGISGRIAAAVRFELPPRRPHRTCLLEGAQVPTKTIDATALAEAARSSWKAPQFGPLGRAAKVLREERDARLAGRRHARGRGGYSGGGGGGGGGGVTGSHAAAGWSNQQRQNYATAGAGAGADAMPGWLGGQQRGAHPEASAMFGGLGAHAQPSHAYAQHAQTQGARGYWQASAQAPVQALPAWQQQPRRNTQPAWAQAQSQAQTQPHARGHYTQYGQPGGAVGGYSYGAGAYDAVAGAVAGAGAGAYNFAVDPNAYLAHGGGGGGLTGATAMGFLDTLARQQQQQQGFGGGGNEQWGGADAGAQGRGAGGNAGWSVRGRNARRQ